MSARKPPRYKYESPNIVIVPTLSFCKVPSTKYKDLTVEKTKTVDTKEKVETFQIPCIIQNNNGCESVLNQNSDPVTSVPVTRDWHVDYVQNSSQFHNYNFEWSMDNPPNSVQLTQTRSRQSEATKDEQLPSESEKNILQTKPLESPVETDEKEIKMPKGITKQTEFENKTKSINQNHTKMPLFETTNDSTKQNKISRTKQKGISPTKVNHTHNKKPTQQYSQSDRRSKQKKSKKNEDHDSVSRTVDKRKFKRMQRKSTSSDQIKQLSLELKKVENEIQKRKRELMIKEMLIQKEQQVTNRAKLHEQTNKDKDDTLSVNNLAKSKSLKSTIIKSYKNELHKKSKLKKAINKPDGTDDLVSKIQNIKKKYDILKSKASKEILTRKHAEKKILHIKSVVNVPQQFSLNDTVTLQNQYKEKYTTLQNYLTKPPTRTIQQSKIGPQSQEENLKRKCKIKYRNNVFKGNHDNMHILLNNENKETEEQFSDRQVKLQNKRKREKNNQNQPVDEKRFKKIDFIINVVTEGSKLSTESEEKETTFEEECYPAMDLSFLDDINVDEIAEYLNVTHNIKKHDVTETENRKTLHQSVSLKESINHSTNKHDTHELTPHSLFVAPFESEATNSYDKFKDLTTPTDNNYVSDNTKAKILGEQICNNNENFDETFLNVELLMEQMFYDNADKGRPVSRSLVHPDQKILVAEKNHHLSTEIDQPSEELNINECVKNSQVEKFGINANKTCETTCFTNTFNSTTKKIETFVSKQGFNDIIMNIGETKNVHQKEINQDENHKTIFSDNKLSENESLQLGQVINNSSYSAQKNRFTNDYRQTVTKIVRNNTETTIKPVLNDASITVVETDNLFDITGKANDDIDVKIVEPMLETEANDNSDDKIVELILETVDLTKEDMNIGETEDVLQKEINQDEDHKTIFPDNELISENETEANDNSDDKIVELILETVDLTKEDIKIGETEDVLQKEINQDEDHKTIFPDNELISENETKANDNSDVKMVEPILETVDLTKEEVFIIQLSSDDSSSRISSDLNKSTDTDDSILDVHIRCKEIVDLKDSVENNDDNSNTSNHSEVPEIKSTEKIVGLNLIDSTKNDNYHSNTSNYLEEPEIKSTAGSQIKDQTNQELIDEQPNAWHEIVLSSEQINAKCRNNTAPCQENSTMKNEADCCNKTKKNVVTAADDPYNASITETVVETDDLLDISKEANNNSDVKIVVPILETEANHNSDVKMVEPILKTVDVTKEKIFAMQVCSDDSTSISPDSSKNTDTDDSILDIHIKCKDIVDLKDTVENNYNHSHTSNHLEVPEIKSTASIQVEEQTNQENIDDQPNAQREIVLSEQINAKCQNNTSPFKETTLKNEAEIRVNSAVQDIKIAEKNLPTHDKKNSANIAEQSCATKFKSIDPTRNLTSDINDKPLVKNMTERILEYIGIKYTVASLIHNGTFSQIFKCKDSAGNEIAAKVLKVDDVTTGYETEQMLMKVQDGVPKEKFSCVYLINGLAVGSKWCYLLEYYPKNLQQALNESGKSFHIDTMLYFAQQLVSAVVILRNNNIVHSDIKPSHILVDSNNKQLKLCGFDTAYNVDHVQLTGVAGTTNYRAPEAILGYSEGHSVDVWATAVVLHEMVTNRKLFPGSNNNEVLYQQMCVLGNIPLFMVQKSEFRNTYFRGNCFLRRRPFEAILNFSRRAKVTTSVSEAYYRDWYHLRNVAQREKDFARLREFCNVLNQMLVLDPSRRLTIEFVYAHPLIYSQ